MDPDSLENLYYAIASLVVAVLAFQGWRQGVGRQAATLLAIASAYVVAFFGARPMAPYFEFLGYPEPITKILAGAFAGLMTLIVISTLGRFLFKPTAKRNPGAARWVYGSLGASLGLIFGVVIFLIVTEVIRLTGALVNTNVQIARAAAVINPEAAQPMNPMITGIANLSTALDQGGSGDFFRKVDPVPPSVFATIGKLGKMLATPDAADRFLAYPGVSELARHPKILALRQDPEVMKLLASQSYLTLLRHEKIRGVANDPDLAQKLRETDFNKALDHALQPPGQLPPRPNLEREDRGSGQ